MLITKSVYKKIINSYHTAPPENGGILGEKNGIICAYVHDQKIQTREAAIYEPDIEFLNEQIEKWAEQSIMFAGIIHSHMVGQESLSVADIEYAEKMFWANPGLRKMFFPLIIPGHDIFVYEIRTEKDKVIVETDSLVVQKEGGENNG